MFKKQVLSRKPLSWSNSDENLAFGSISTVLSSAFDPTHIKTTLRGHLMRCLEKAIRKHLDHNSWKFVSDLSCAWCIKNKVLRDHFEWGYYCTSLKINGYQSHV